MPILVRSFRRLGAELALNRESEMLDCAAESNLRCAWRDIQDVRDLAMAVVQHNAEHDYPSQGGRQTTDCATYEIVLLRLRVALFADGGAIDHRFIEITRLSIAALRSKPHQRGPHRHSLDPSEEVASAITRNYPREATEDIVQHVLRILTPGGQSTRHSEKRAAIVTI
jgi:hypothetical protein